MAAPERNMWIGASIYDSGQFSVTVPDLEDSTVFRVKSARIKRTVENRPLPSWAYYLAGVAIILSNAGMTCPGADMVLAGEEPSGPRYEYSMGMAFAALWYQYNAKPFTQSILIELMEQIRHDYIDN
jgi:galactokinase